MLNIKENISLSKYTTFKIGGVARFFVEVKKEKDIISALEYAKEKKLKFFILGGGSNVLFGDDGFDGLVIKIQATNYKLQANKIHCDAGLSLSEAVKISLENSLIGLEWAAGIPGSVGGAIRGNAGAFGGSMADLIQNIKILKIGKNGKTQIINYKLDDCDFSYRSSIFKKNENLIILSAVFKLIKGDKKEIDSKIKEVIEKRKEKQPKGLGSAGSFYKNPIVKNQDLIREFKKEKGYGIYEGRIPAGWIIEKAGIKGKRIGNIMVSEKNANFIVNLGGGKAEEIMMLNSIIKQKVKSSFGIQLEEEVKIVL